MKHGALDHYKTKKLARVLDLPLYAVVGILETLWHRTAKYAPRGNIGKLTNEDIATELDWSGDADGLIDALISCGWVDEHAEYRLVIHDWSDHAENSVRMDLVRKSLRFCDGRRAKPNQHLRIGGTATKAQRRRERERAAGPIPPNLRKRLLLSAHYCNRCLATDDLTLDHVVPISKGGMSVIENLQVLCRRCNSSKKDRVPT